MVTHDELQQDVAAYVAGHLDDAPRAALERHLSDCVECQEAVAFAEALAAEVRAEHGAVAADHPEPRELQALAESSDPAGESPIARHVAACSSCALEVDAWRGREMLQPRRRPAPTFAWRPLAAGALFGAAASVLIMLALPSRVEAPQGVAPRLVANPPLRGRPAPAKTVVVPAGQRFFGLLVPLALPSASDPDVPTGYRFEIVDASGTPTWGAELTVDESRSAAGSEGVLLFAGVPAGDHPPGRYRLKVAEERPRGAEPLLDQPFEIVREE